MRPSPQGVPIVNHDAVESGKIAIFYEILNKKPFKSFKKIDLPKYDEVLGDLYLHIQEFENKIVLYEKQSIIVQVVPFDPLR